MSDKLKPGMAEKLIKAVFRADCPFCGEEVDTIGDKNPIVIHECKIAGTNFRVLEKFWNNRPTEKAAKEEVLMMTGDLLKERLAVLRAGQQPDEPPISRMIPYSRDYIDGREYEIKRQIEVVDKAYKEWFGEQG